MEEDTKNIHYLPCDDLLGQDMEARVDGTHATVQGFMRMAKAFEPDIKELLK